MCEPLSAEFERKSGEYPDYAGTESEVLLSPVNSRYLSVAQIAEHC